MTIEIWKPIDGYDGYYFVSNMGRVMSSYRISGNGNIINEAIKKQRTCKGYSVVSIKYNNVKKALKVHRLVAITFLDNPQKKPEVNHKNGVKSDNRVENLEWVSSSENSIHAFATGLRKQYTGEAHYNSIRIKQYSKEGALIKEWGAMADACRVYDIKPQSLSSCLTGKSRTSGGFKWEYA